MRVWSYIVNGQQTNHQTAQTLLDLIQKGELPKDALLYGPKMTAWRPAIEVRHLLKTDALNPVMYSPAEIAPRIPQPGETIAVLLNLAGAGCLIAALLVLTQLANSVLPGAIVVSVSISATWAGLVCFWMASISGMLAELVMQGRKK